MQTADTENDYEEALLFPSKQLKYEFILLWRDFVAVPHNFSIRSFQFLKSWSGSVKIRNFIIIDDLLPSLNKYTISLPFGSSYHIQDLYLSISLMKTAT